MDKVAYSRLIIVWHRHKPLHVRSKILYVFRTVLIAALLGYLALNILHSKVLFCILMITVAMRFFYRMAKGDWFDLASQLGLKCWHCDTVFNRDIVIQDVMDKNACPKCGHPVYEDSSG